MLTSEILIKKRDKNQLSESEIKYLVSGVVSGEVSEAQAAAFLMASSINGLNAKETAFLTHAMAESGTKLSFAHLGKPIIDKHSTGGVGDKVSLLIVPIISSCGILTPMISGRGLGHTGGTVDKLESIHGFNTMPDEAMMNQHLKENSGFIIGQSENIAPADKILYKLRDITGTVESVGLITASILSKKVAEGLDGLIMDIKFGNGAFMSTFDDAKILAKSMLNVATEMGLAMRILFSSMNQPLGKKVGNWLEIEEVEESLKGNCPDDLKEIAEFTCSSMLLLAKLASDRDSALSMVRGVWNSGLALDKFYSIIKSQGGDIDLSRKLYSNVEKFELKSTNSGFIDFINTRKIGLAAIHLGAGRKLATDTIDFSAGLEFKKKIGDRVESGETICIIQAKDQSVFPAALDILNESYSLSANPAQLAKSIIYEEWTN
ncbi:MAG: thymidine phosphorylase [Candidatus Kapabacteria bacterium]|nr:thymidine phosphorylase [Candidatus Kapabacteria bacterium]